MCIVHSCDLSAEQDCVATENSTVVFRVLKCVAVIVHGAIGFLDPLVCTCIRV